MIAVIDYGAGNLFSVKNALDYLGEDSVITSNKDDIIKADKLILPGVGAFPDAMRKLTESGLADTVKSLAKEKYLLGICLGMQMLFEKSFEFSETDGLGLIEGTVELMTPENLPVPHMGWNRLEKNTVCALSKSIGINDYVYFVHSYAAVCKSENVAAYCDYGTKVPSLVFKDKVFGCQFHPEKSGDVGLGILKAFCALYS